MPERITIELPPITVSYDAATKLWNWQSPNGAFGSHEKSARAAALTAINGLNIPASSVKLPEAASIEVSQM